MANANTKRVKSSEIELKDKLVGIQRVTKVTKGGRHFSFSAIVVVGNESIALEHVLNYPNPFMDNTAFQFEHNLQNQIVDVQIRVFSVSGRLVKTIDEQILTEGTRVTGIQWDGTDEYGDQLGRGVYLYKVKISGTGSTGDTINSESDFEKLVILK